MRTKEQEVAFRDQISSLEGKKIVDALFREQFGASCPESIELRLDDGSSIMIFPAEGLEIEFTLSLKS